MSTDIREALVPRLFFIGIPPHESTFFEADADSQMPGDSILQLVGRVYQVDELICDSRADTDGKALLPVPAKTEENCRAGCKTLK